MSSTRRGFAFLDRVKALELPLRRHLLPDRFHRIEVETDSRCNRSCYYCPVAVDRRPAHQMSEELFGRIVDQLAELRFRGRFSPHFFGEPLLDKRLPSLVSLVRRRVPHAQVVVYTNGDLLTPDRAQSLLEAGVGLFLVTFEEGPTKAWRQTEAVLTPRERRRFVVRGFEEGVQSPFNRGGYIRFPGRELHQKACFAPASTLVVDAWGKVRLCPNDYYGEVEWGDLNHERLADVWSKPDFAALRRDLLAGRFEKPICRACVGLEEREPLAVNPARRPGVP